MKDEFENEDFCTSVFDEFFFTCINVDNMTRHLMRLLWWIHTKLPPARISTLLKVNCYFSGGGGWRQVSFCEKITRIFNSISYIEGVAIAQFVDS